MSTTNYMNITLPTPTTTAGPEWATELNTAVEVVDAHDHTPGKGTKVPAAGLNINGDLDFQQHNLISAKSVQLADQNTSLPATNVQAIYSVSGNLFYNDNAGTPIQMTSGGSIATPSSSNTPAGIVLPYAGISAPSGYLLADGSAVSRATYAALFSAIGTLYGVGDGSTTFNLPNLAGRTPIGAGTYTDAVSGSVTRTLADSVGAEKHQLSVAELASHTHTDSGHTHSLADANQPNDIGAGTGQRLYIQAPGGFSAPTTTGYANLSNTGSGTAHNNMQPSLVLNYIIKT